jgi:hypothetical protein
MYSSQLSLFHTPSHHAASLQTNSRVPRVTGALTERSHPQWRPRLLNSLTGTLSSPYSLKRLNVSAVSPSTCVSSFPTGFPRYPQLDPRLHSHLDRHLCSHLEPHPHSHLELHPHSHLHPHPKLYHQQQLHPHNSIWGTQDTQEPTAATHSLTSQKLCSIISSLSSSWCNNNKEAPGCTLDL